MPPSLELPLAAPEESAAGVPAQPREGKLRQLLTFLLPALSLRSPTWTEFINLSPFSIKFDRNTDNNTGRITDCNTGRNTDSYNIDNINLHGQCGLLLPIYDNMLIDSYNVSNLERIANSAVRSHCITISCYISSIITSNKPAVVHVR